MKITVIQSENSILMTSKKFNPLHNQYDMNLSRYNNQYLSHPIRKQYVDDVQYFQILPLNS